MSFRRAFKECGKYRGCDFFARIHSGRSLPEFWRTRYASSATTECGISCHDQHLVASGGCSDLDQPRPGDQSATERPLWVESDHSDIALGIMPSSRAGMSMITRISTSGTA